MLSLKSTYRRVLKAVRTGLDHVQTRITRDPSPPKSVEPDTKPKEPEKLPKDEPDYDNQFTESSPIELSQPVVPPQSIESPQPTVPPQHVKPINLSDRVTPIHDLPPELLRTIFEFYLQEGVRGDFSPVHSCLEPTLSSTPFTFASPHTVAKVCHSWKRASLFENLWASLSVYKPRPAHVEAITTWLDRATIHPLTICLHAPDEDKYDSDAIWCILKILLARMDQIQRITIKLAGDFPIVLTSLDSLVAPLLESAEFYVRGYTHSNPILRVFQNAEKSRRIIWNPSEAQRSFPLIDYGVLTHLRVPMVPVKEQDLDDLVRVLIYCENLVNLEIDMSMPPADHDFRPRAIIYDDAQRVEAWRHMREHPLQLMEGYIRVIALSGAIVLPHLRHLKIDAYEHDATSLLDRISVPELVSLSIHHHTHRTTSTKGIASLLARSKAHPTSLTLSGSTLSETDILEHLIDSPYLDALQDLGLSVAPLGNFFLFLMTLGTHNRMPDLRKLMLKVGNVSNLALSKMAMSRHEKLEEVSIYPEPTLSPIQDQVLNLNALESMAESYCGNFEKRSNRWVGPWPWPKRGNNTL